MQEMSRLLSYACAATLCLGLAVVTGCGGGGEGGIGASGKLTGNTTQSSGASTNTVAIPVPAAGGTEVKVLVGGKEVAVIVPSSTITDNIPPGAVISVIETGSALIQGDFGDGAALGIGGDLDSAGASLAGKTSGITLSALGNLVQSLGIPIAPGPTGTRIVLSLPQGNVKTRTLTIGKTSIDGNSYIRGGKTISHVPTKLEGNIPNNGENAAGAKETVTWGEGNVGRLATLDIVYGNGFSLHQSRSIKTDNTATFENLTVDSQNVPDGGVESVLLTVGPQTF